MPDQRYETIDIIKGMAIILMVYGHTFGALRSFVYLFHMPVFFMVSGYCWNSRHSASRDSRQGYVFDKARKLLVPMFTCYIAVILLRNVFVRLHFYSDDPAFLVAGDTAPISQYNVMPESFHDMVVHCYQTLIFKYEPPQLGGPVWFLYALFMVNVAHCYITCCISKAKHRTTRIVLWGLVFIVFCYLALVFSNGHGADYIEIRHLRLPAGFVCYLLGKNMGIIASSVSVRKKLAWFEVRSFFAWILCGTSIIGLCLLLPYGTLELSTASIINPAFLAVSALCGWSFLYTFALSVQKMRFSRLIEYTGKHTMSVVTLHLFAFKLVNWVIVRINHLTAYWVASYPIIFSVSESVKLIYTFVGVALPLLCSIGIRRLKGTVPK